MCTSQQRCAQCGQGGMVPCSAGVWVVGRQSACLLMRLSGCMMLAVPWFFLGAGFVGMQLDTCTVARHSACTVVHCMCPCACMGKGACLRAKHLDACTRWWLVALPVCRCHVVCGCCLAGVGCVLKRAVLSGCHGWVRVLHPAACCLLCYTAAFAAHTAGVRTAVVLAHGGTGGSLAAETLRPL
jgi:hypothetical protein